MRPLATFWVPCETAGATGISPRPTRCLRSVDSSVHRNDVFPSNRSFIRTSAVRTYAFHALIVSCCKSFALAGAEAAANSAIARSALVVIIDRLIVPSLRAGKATDLPIGKLLKLLEIAGIYLSCSRHEIANGSRNREFRKRTEAVYYAPP